MIDERIESLMRDVGFVEHWLGDKSGRWHQIDFKFGGGEFEFVVDIDDKKWWLTLGGSCSEEITKGDLTYEELYRVLNKWEVI